MKAAVDYDLLSHKLDAPLLQQDNQVFKRKRETVLVIKF